MKNNNKKIKVNDSSSALKPCTLCNPRKYLKFSFAYISYESYSPKEQDIIKMWERMRWMSAEPFVNMVFKYGKDKSKWFENIPLSKIKKNVPSKFREEFCSVTNETYAVMRVFPSGTPNGTSNPRIIGMIKNTIFYIFFLDWKGELYNH